MQMQIPPYLLGPALSSDDSQRVRRIEIIVDPPKTALHPALVLHYVPLEPGEHVVVLPVKVVPLLDVQEPRQDILRPAHLPTSDEFRDQLEVRGEGGVARVVDLSEDFTDAPEVPLHSRLEAVCPVRDPVGEAVYAVHCELAMAILK